MEYVPFRMNQAANTGTGQMSNCSKHHFIRLTQGDCVFCLRENAADLEGQLDEAQEEIERLQKELVNWEKGYSYTVDVKEQEDSITKDNR